MGESIILQVVNGYLAITGLGALIIFLRYFKNNIHQGYVYLRPAIALMVLFVGSELFRGAIFITRTLVNAGYSVKEPDTLILVGGIVVEASYLCIIRVFSPDKWGHNAWILTYIASTVAVLASLLFVHWSPL